LEYLVNATFHDRYTVAIGTSEFLKPYKHGRGTYA